VRILWLKTELLHPVDKGGKIRTYQMLRALKREHRVTYLTLDDGSATQDASERAGEYCHELVCVPHRTREKFSAGFYAELAANLCSPLPYFMRKYENGKMRREVESRASSGELDLLVCDFLNPAVNVPPGLPVPAVLFQHNVESRIWRRHCEVQTNPVKRAYLYDQWRKAFSYERAACRRFDLVVTVSRDDAEIIRRDYGVESVADVPTGVDTDFFRPSGGVEPEPDSLVFTGSMDWLPNEDAIQFFTREIMPLVRERVPGVRLTIVGRTPYASLVKLAARDPAIVVTGRVEDVRPYMERAAAYVVPIRVGGGTRLKIYEALAMEKPVVSTTVGAEGLRLKDGEDLLIADAPRDFAAAVVRVLQDARLARHLGTRGAEKVRGRFGWDVASAIFAQHCRRAAAPRGRRLLQNDIITAGAQE
jgi:sugar transferase (PEP-CTERM/EpsH1 system associated)